MVQNLIDVFVKNVIVCDFDGTIIRDTNKIDISDEYPLPLVKDGLKILKDSGYRIKIWSCRTSSLFPLKYRSLQQKMIENFLDKYNISYDAVLNIDKPFCLAYLDSRCAKPDWKNILNQIEEVKEQKF